MSAATPFAKTQASVHLDAIRGLAAVVVLLTHWRALLFVDYAGLAHQEKILAAPLYLASQGGHLAVDIFFVLSGYLITGSVIRNLGKGTFTLLDYGSHRLIRLWTVLLPSLVVGGLFDWIGMHHAGAADLYRGLVPNHTTIDAFATLNPLGALRSTVFLQTIRGGGVFGSNVPLWSVAYEFWYYALFPAAYLLLCTRQTATRRWTLAIVLALMCWLVRVEVLKMFPFWLAGMALHYLPALSLTRSRRALAAAAYLVIFVAGSVVSHALHTDTAKYLLDATMIVPTVLFLWVLLSSTGSAQESLYKRGAKRLAGFSYTLYTIHFPTLMLFTALVLGTGRWQPSPLHVVEGLLALALAFAVTMALHFFFEGRTAVLQRAADRWTAPAVVTRSPAPEAGILPLR